MLGCVISPPKLFFFFFLCGRSVCHVCEKAGRLPAELGELRGCTGHAVLSYPLPVEAAFSPKKMPYGKKKKTQQQSGTFPPSRSAPPKKPQNLNKLGGIALEVHQIHRGQQRASVLHVDAAQLRPAVGRHLAVAEKKAIRIQEY